MTGAEADGISQSGRIMNIATGRLIHGEPPVEVNGNIVHDTVFCKHDPQVGQDAHIQWHGQSGRVHRERRSYAGLRQSCAPWMNSARTA